MIMPAAFSAIMIGDTSTVAGPAVVDDIVLRRRADLGLDHPVPGEAA
jgi:hypothetical protein